MDINSQIAQLSRQLESLRGLMARDPAQEYQYNRDLAGTSKVLFSFPRYVFKTATVDTASITGSPNVFGLDINTHVIEVGVTGVRSASTGVGLGLKVELCQDINFGAPNTDSTFVFPNSAVAVSSSIGAFAILGVLPCKGVRFVRLTCVTIAGTTITFANFSAMGPYVVRAYGE